MEASLILKIKKGLGGASTDWLHSCLSVGAVHACIYIYIYVVRTVHPVLITCNCIWSTFTNKKMYFSIQYCTCTSTGGDEALLASLMKSPTRSTQVHPVTTNQPSLDQLRAWEEEKEALRRYTSHYILLSYMYVHVCTVVWAPKQEGLGSIPSGFPGFFFSSSCMAF